MSARVTAPSGTPREVVKVAGDDEDDEDDKLLIPCQSKVQGATEAEATWPRLEVPTLSVSIESATFVGRHCPSWGISF
jgi:hypothetical protein